MKIILEPEDAIAMIRRPEVAVLIQGLEKVADESTTYDCPRTDITLGGEVVLALFFDAWDRKNIDDPTHTNHPNTKAKVGV